MDCDQPQQQQPLFADAAVHFLRTYLSETATRADRDSAYKAMFYAYLVDESDCDPDQVFSRAFYEYLTTDE